MSQSDYVKYKRTGVQLRNIAKEPGVLSPALYTAFVNYNLETTVKNTSVNYAQPVLPATTQSVFNMKINNVSTCPGFTLCENTNSRPNRRPVPASRIAPRPLRKFLKGVDPAVAIGGPSIPWFCYRSIGT